MRLLLIAFGLLNLLSAPVHAACDGQDLTPTLTADERAALDARLDGMPYPEGNHWRATRGQEVVHLIGTVHLSDQRLDGPTERLTPLVETASLLLLEMTATEQAKLESALKTSTDMLLLPEGTLPDLLPESDWDQLAKAMRERGLPPFMAAKMRPWYVSMLLSIPACLHDQLTKPNGLDTRLEAAAEAAGVQTRALEPFETAFETFAGMPLDTQLLMIRSALTGPDIGEDVFETMLSAYFEERPAAGQVVLELLSPRLTPLDEAENAQVFQAMDKALIGDRNRAWIPVILGALEENPGHVVAAFGAAHLPGEEGVLRLLEAEGFTLDRLPF